ncbi:MAG: DUF3168 domain-containing protein [Chloroflexi bacterium]|nr:DUF3168 domain-containing protein [Chloroflexota bacterium]
MSVSIEVGIVRVLNAASSVTNLTSTRIYTLGSVPQTPTLPYIRVRRISTVRLNHAHDGPSGLARPRIECRCVATTSEGAKQLAAAVRNALVGYRGNCPGANPVRIDSIVTAGEHDDYETDTQRHVEDIDFFSTFKEV